jgi:hypothetical protein
MKLFTISSATAAAAAVITTLGAPAVAHAGVITTPGSACKAYSSPSADALSAIASNQSGTTNSDLSISRKVICPVTRTGSDGDGVTVWADVQGKPEAPVSCVVYSYDFKGQQLASRGFVATGLVDQYMKFNGLEAPYYGSMSMVCSLPSLSRGKVISVTAN